MRSLVLAALLTIAACKGPGGGKIPEGWTEINQHPEFHEFRPTAIAVLPVDAPINQIRTELRTELYQRIFSLRYSAIKLETVDAHMSTAGVFEPGSLVCDATLHTTIEKWEAVSGSTAYVATGKARMVHKSGELLWECLFYERTFQVHARAGETDISGAIVEIAKFFVKRMPKSPPPAE